MKENIQIRNLAALRAIKEATLAVMDPEKSGSPRVVVGLATCGIAAGAQDVYDALKNELKAQGIHEYIHLHLQLADCFSNLEKRAQEQHCPQEFHFRSSSTPFYE